MILNWFQVPTNLTEDRKCFGAYPQLTNYTQLTQMPKPLNSLILWDFCVFKFIWNEVVEECTW